MVTDLRKSEQDEIIRQPFSPQFSFDFAPFETSLLSQCRQISYVYYFGFLHAQQKETSLSTVEMCRDTRQQAVRYSSGFSMN
jgi:hypothetical protein